MNILAIGAHPDDLEIGCGGTLAKYGAAGNKVFMCIVSSGNVGHKIIPPEELVKIRRMEALESGKVIGAEVVFLEESDLFVRAENMQTREKIVDVIRDTKPDLIITHNPRDYMDDHEETSKLVYGASMAATVPYYPTRYEHYPRLVPIYYMEPLCGVNSLPGEYVDITGFIETKLQMLEKHASQVKWLKDHDGMDMMDMVKTMAKFRGYQCDTGYAEGFTHCRTYHKLTAKRLLP
ncbi:MAG: PIG-L deacetylase family protein [Bacillota bacterium]